MHNQPLNRRPLPQSANASSNASNSTNSLDWRLTRALESAPTPKIPADFAARLAANLPTRPPASIPATHYGRTAMLIGIFVMLAAMLILAASMANHPVFQLALECTLFAQFVALILWVSAYRSSVN